MSSRAYRRRQNRRYVLSKPFHLVILLMILYAVSFFLSSKINPEVTEHRAVETPAIEASTTHEVINKFDKEKLTRQDQVPAGTQIDEYNGIPVYSNGTNYVQDHGLNFSENGYYFGYKWQCVEFVKRYYYTVLDHEMPDGAGHAKYFFDPTLSQGQYNEQRGLFQYKNGGDVKPELDDLLVFNDTAYGHVAIVSGVGEDWIEVIQQNSEYPRERFALEEEDGNYYIHGERDPAGWLRK